MKFINTHHYRYRSQARRGNAQTQDAGASSQAFPRRAWERSSFSNRSAGFTLIEIMISLIVGAFLIGGVLQIFLNTQKTYRMQENLSRIQENGRFALEFISRDLRMADYRACYSDASVATAVSGTNNSTSAPPAVGTDTIKVTWKTNACSAAATTESREYRIQSNGLRRDIGDGNGFQELIENITDLQILYGVDIGDGTPGNTDRDGTPDYYVDAATITVPDWSKVISARITLTAQSNDTNLVTSGDTRLHRTFKTTVLLRNRL